MTTMIEKLAGLSNLYTGDDERGDSESRSVLMSEEIGFEKRDLMF